MRSDELNAIHVRIGKPGEIVDPRGIETLKNTFGAVQYLDKGPYIFMLGVRAGEHDIQRKLERAFGVGYKHVGSGVFEYSDEPVASFWPPAVP